MRGRSTFVLVLLFLAILAFCHTPAFAETKIVINKGTNQLAFFKEGYLIDVLPVATGRLPQYTPEGRWRVVVKLVYPSWRNPKGGPVIPGGVPANPLGPRWLGLNALDTGGSSYGIHGNNNPSSIGAYASSGCVRMRNEDITWLYELVPVGTGVEIINTKENLLNWKKYTRVTVNGVPVQFTPRLGPVRAGEASYLPVRPVAAALGFRMTWDDSSKTLLLANIDREVLLTIGSSLVTVNNRPEDAGEAPFLLENTAYLRDSCFQLFLGAQIKHEEESRTISYNIPEDPSGGRLVRYHLSMKVNGKDVDIPDLLTPLTDGEGILVPVRLVCAAVGAAVNYNDEKKELEMRITGRRVTIPLAGGSALINGLALKTPPSLFLYNGTSYVNLNFLSEALGFRIDLNVQSRSLSIATFNLTSMFSNPFRCLEPGDLKIILAARGYSYRM